MSGTNPSGGTGKAIAAGVVALGGAALLGWTLYDTYWRPEPPIARVAAADSEAKKSDDATPAKAGEHAAPESGNQLKLSGKEAEAFLNRPRVEMVADARFPSVKSDEDAAGLVKDLSQKYFDSLGVVGEVSNAPAQAAEQLQSVTQTFLGRLMAGPTQDPLEVIRALGGETKDAKGEPIKGAVVTRLAELLTHASIDVSKAKIIKPFEMQLPGGKALKLPTPPGGSNPDAMMQMMNVNRTSRDDKAAPTTGGETASGGVRAAGDRGISGEEDVEATLTTPLMGLFPGINVDQKIPRIEVRAPIQFKDAALTDGKPTQIGLVLALNPSTNKWQPASLNFYAASLDTLKAIGKSMRKDAKAESKPAAAQESK
ncbi:MAG: hypothetical protein SFY96_01725 [Planctomycetota bacterium]|nr:hypothetical protein [Planctomycetota bacterium]